MANQDLRGKNIILPEDIKKFLQQRINLGPQSEGFSRVQNLISSGVCTYENLKRIKHDIENIYQDKGSWSTLLNWVNYQLGQMRSMSQDTKENLSNLGFNNSFKSEYDKEYINPGRVKHYKSDFMEYFIRFKKLINY